MWKYVFTLCYCSFTHVFTQRGSWALHLHGKLLLNASNWVEHQCLFLQCGEKPLQAHWTYDCCCSDTCSHAQCLSKPLCICCRGTSCPTQTSMLAGSSVTSKTHVWTTGNTYAHTKRETHARIHAQVIKHGENSTLTHKLQLCKAKPSATLKICISHELHFSSDNQRAKSKRKKDIATLQHSTCVSSKDPDDALRSMGSVGFVARLWSALFWSGWGWAVCVLSVGAFGVTEVSGLRVLLCEAAALHPPAALLPWCGASVYLKAECKFTTLVKTSRSQNTQAQYDKYCEPKHDKASRHSEECLICSITHLPDLIQSNRN